MRKLREESLHIKIYIFSSPSVWSIQIPRCSLSLYLYIHTQIKENGNNRKLRHKNQNNRPIPTIFFSIFSRLQFHQQANLDNFLSSIPSFLTYIHTLFSSGGYIAQFFTRIRYIIYIYIYKIICSE